MKAETQFAVGFIHGVVYLVFVRRSWLHVCILCLRLAVCH